MRRRVLGVAAVMTALAAWSSAGAQADTIRVQSTTDTVDAGLVDGLIKPMYLAAQPGDTLNYVGVGTGAALNNARAGLADVVITHAPSLEAQFVTDGYSLEPFGRAIFYSDYVIVGPIDDPAGVLANHPHDAIGALEDIATAGGAGTQAADFLSRANASGTSVQEQIMWGLTTSVTKQKAFDAPVSDTTRFEPGSGGTYPVWYHHNPSGQAANLQTADTCPTATYPSGECYTLVDRGTFNKLLNAGTITHLKIVSQNNDTGVRGGKDLLINPFSTYIVNPAASFPGGSLTPNVAAATRFVDFLTSQAFQDAVDTFPTTTDPAFRSDAYPAFTLVHGLPPTATAGTAVHIDAIFKNKLPGAPAVDGLPVQLQKSTDGGSTYADVGSPIATDPTGAVSFTESIGATTSFRFDLPRYKTFSPNTQDIGVVSVTGGGTTPPPPPPPPGPPPPPPPPSTDTTKPNVSKAKFSGKTFSLTVSEAGKITVTIARRKVKSVVKNGKTTRTTSYKTVKTFTLKATKAGKVSRKLAHRLPAGNYRVKLRATDLAGNVRNKEVTLHVKKAA